MTPSNATRRATRHQARIDRRRHEELPLFATAPAVLEQVAPLPAVAALEHEQRLRMADLYARMLKMRLLSIRAWAHYRAVAERYITMDQVAHMEAYCRRTYPPYEHDPGYRVDYWYQFLRRVGL